MLVFGATKSAMAAPAAFSILRWLEVTHFYSTFARRFGFLLCWHIDFLSNSLGRVEGLDRVAALCQFSLPVPV